MAALTTKQGAALFKLYICIRKRDRKCDLFFVAEKEGFARQSPQPTPLAGEVKVAKCLEKMRVCM